MGASRVTDVTVNGVHLLRVDYTSLRSDPAMAEVHNAAMRRLRQSTGPVVVLAVFKGARPGTKYLNCVTADAHEMQARMSRTAVVLGNHKATSFFMEMYLQFAGHKNLGAFPDESQALAWLTNGPVESLTRPLTLSDRVRQLGTSTDGRRVILCDFRGLTKDSDIIDTYEHGVDYCLARGVGHQLLIDFTGVSLDREAGVYLAKRSQAKNTIGEDLAPYVAVIGLTGFKAVLAETVCRLRGVKLRGFKHRADALTWLHADTAEVTTDAASTGEFMIVSREAVFSVPPGLDACWKQHDQVHYLHISGRASTDQELAELLLYMSREVEARGRAVRVVLSCLEAPAGLRFSRVAGPHLRHLKKSIALVAVVVPGSTPRPPHKHIQFFTSVPAAAQWITRTDPNTILAKKLLIARKVVYWAKYQDVAYLQARFSGLQGADSLVVVLDEIMRVAKEHGPGMRMLCDFTNAGITREFVERLLVYMPGITGGVARTAVIGASPDAVTLATPYLASPAAKHIQLFDTSTPALAWLTDRTPHLKLVHG